MCILKFFSLYISNPRIVSYNSWLVIGTYQPEMSAST